MWPNIEYKLVILKKTSDQRFVFVKQLGIDIAKDRKVWRKNTYFYSAADISYTRGRKSFIFKELENGNTILRWGKTDAAVAPTEPGADTFKGLIHQALSSMGGEYGLAMLLIVGIAGVVGGLLLGISPLGDWFTGGGEKAAELVALLVK